MRCVVWCDCVAHLSALVCKATWHVVYVLVLARCVCVVVFVLRGHLGLGEWLRMECWSWSVCMAMWSSGMILA